ncbi:MAG: hypothetical protein J1F67_11965 [Muribaculaceae bacterium]|nr:hypothetical protein [Muribaculaceae bacterium]
MSRGFTKKIADDILRDILNSNKGIFAFQIPGKYKVRVEDLFNFIYEKSNWIDYSEGMLTIKPSAKEAVRVAVNPRRKITGQELNRLNIPFSFVGDQIDIDDFYCPKKILKQRNKRN